MIKAKLDDRGCNQECMRDGGTVHEFKGPVKIVLVDPPEDLYNRRKSGASFIAFASMMFFTNTFIMILFTLGFKLPLFSNAHIAICTIGCQFLMPSALLTVQGLFGPSSPLKKSQRRFDHVGISTLCLISIIGGSVMVIEYGEVSSMQPDQDRMATYHFFAGCATIGLTALCYLSGITLYLKSNEIMCPGRCTQVHRFFGIVAFLASSVCFILGVIKPSVQIFLFLIAYLCPTYFILFFTIFYTITILVTPGRNLCAKKGK